MMTLEERKPDVAAVLAKTLADVGVPHVLDVAGDLLDALTKAGYVVLEVPEGVAVVHPVAHGARLVSDLRQMKRKQKLYAIEDTP